MLHHQPWSGVLNNLNPWLPGQLEWTTELRRSGVLVKAAEGSASSAGALPEEEVPAVPAAGFSSSAASGIDSGVMLLRCLRACIFCFRCSSWLLLMTIFGLCAAPFPEAAPPPAPPGVGGVVCDAAAGDNENGSSAAGAAAAGAAAVDADVAVAAAAAGAAAPAGSCLPGVDDPPSCEACGPAPAPPPPPPPPAPPWPAAASIAATGSWAPPAPAASWISCMNACGFCWMTCTSSGWLCARAGSIWAIICGFCANTPASCANWGLFLSSWSSGGMATPPPPPPPLPRRLMAHPRTQAVASMGSAHNARTHRSRTYGNHRRRLPSGAPSRRCCTTSRGLVS
mmetsp:Transcript_96104/g.240900  ORF Transcript_96104/g.240900 Transcript_96104/m.240900 type:complete len:340 (+) Transcript_96104:155-1174(+)